MSEPIPYPCPECQAPVHFEGAFCSNCDPDEPQRIYRDREGRCPAHDADACEVCPGETLARKIDSLEHRLVEMAGEVCGALGINAPGEDAVANWAAVLDAIRAKRAASDVIGWVLFDKDDRPGYGGMFPSEALADGARNRLNRPGQPLYLCGPWRAVPVGAVTELKPYGWGIAGADGYTAPRHDSLDRKATETNARLLSQPTIARASKIAESAPFRAVQLFYLASPPDRPAGAVELIEAISEATRARKCLYCPAEIEYPAALCENCQDGETPGFFSGSEPRLTRDALSALATEFCRETYGSVCAEGQRLAEDSPYFGWLGMAALLLQWLDARGMLKLSAEGESNE